MISKIRKYLHYSLEGLKRYSDNFLILLNALPGLYLSKSSLAEFPTLQAADKHTTFIILHCIISETVSPIYTISEGERW